MASELPQGFGFAPPHDAPIPYMQRIRDYYQALGYGAPYEWAHYAQVPFQHVGQAADKGSRRHRHHGGALSGGEGRSGPRRAL